MLGSRYAQYMKKPTGSLWEGRHKASAVDEKYVVLSPVTAKMVS